MNFKTSVISLYCINVFIHCHIEAAENAGTKTAQRKKEPTRSHVTTSREWIQESLNTHNFFRSLHKTPPLGLNNTLSEISQYYADRLLELTMKTLDGQDRVKPYFEHNPETGEAWIGENLYYSIMTATIEPVPSHSAVALWYEEIKDYDFSTTKRKLTSVPDAKIGHLTQMLWKGSRQMGSAYASRKLNNSQLVTFVVANYYPTGNIVGNKYYLENVMPPTISEADINAEIVSRNIHGWWNKQKAKSDTSESWRKAALKAHNKHRKQHGSQALRLNKNICRVSQNWADYLLERGLRDFNAYGRVNQIEKNFIATGSSLIGMGESSAFFLTEEDRLSPEQPIRLWYKQVDAYNLAGPQKQNGFKTDGFQQIVWNSTTEFCMSFASSKTEDGQYLTYVVANYYPPMTYVNTERKNNVFPRDKSILNQAGSQVYSSTGAAILTIMLCTIHVLLY